MSAATAPAPLLVTGFEPFGGLAENPSRVLVRELATRGAVAGRPLVAEVLPTEYEASVRVLRARIERHAPVAVVALGVAVDADGLRLERLARNLVDSDAPDNAGEVRVGREISPGGPRLLRTSLPVEQLHARLGAEGWPVSISTDAGTYVCNHLFHALCEERERRGGRLPVGFVHVPDPTRAAVRARGLDATGLATAVRRLLEELVHALDRREARAS